MRNTLIIFASILGMMLATSCADPDKAPIITFDQAGKGAYPRLVQLISGEYDLADISNSKYSYEIEFVDIDKGNTVTEFELFVAFIDNNPGNGEDGVDQSSYQKFTSFTTNANGFQGLSIDLPASEVLSALGLTADQLAAGDFFEFESVIKTSNNTTHTGANSTSTVNGSAFAGWFDFSAKITCPLPDADFAGTYKLTYSETPTGGFGAIFGDDPGTITFAPVSGSSTLRKGSLGYLADSFGPFDVDLVIDFVCDKIVMPTIDTGVGCGGSIAISQGAVSDFELDDDSEFVLNMVEFNPDDGGCGVGEAPITITFTKQ